MSAATGARLVEAPLANDAAVLPWSHHLSVVASGASGPSSVAAFPSAAACLLATTGSQQLVLPLLLPRWLARPAIVALAAAALAAVAAAATGTAWAQSLELRIDPSALQLNAWGRVATTTLLLPLLLLPAVATLLLSSDGHNSSNNSSHTRNSTSSSTSSVSRTASRRAFPSPWRSVAVARRLCPPAAYPTSLVSLAATS